MRIQLANIINPTQPAGSYQVIITTRDTSNNIIDGPTQTSTFGEKQINTPQIADEAIKDSKLSLDSVYTTWEDGNGLRDVLYKRNTVSFDPTVDLTTNDASFAAVAAGALPSGIQPLPPENYVYLVWDSSKAGGRDIFYKRSTDGGANFGDEINLSNNPTFSSEPSVATGTNNDNVYVAWIDEVGGNFVILYRRSTDGGSTFGGTVNLGISSGPGVLGRPALAASGSSVYVVWTQNNDILFRRSDNNGGSFFAAVNLTPEIGGGSNAPGAATSGNNVYAVWHDTRTGNLEIFYRRSTDSGISFGDPVNLSLTSASSVNPAIAATGDNVYVVWRDFGFPGNNEIFYKRSTNAGATFGSTGNISFNPGNSERPAIAASGTNVYVEWDDTTAGNIEILYKRSTDGGAAFGSTINLSNTVGISVRPAIAAVNNLT